MRKSMLLNLNGGVLGKLILLVVVIALIGSAVYLFSGRFNREEACAAGFQKGMGYVTWSASGYLTDGSDESLEKLKQLGANWVSILVTWYQTDPWSSDIHKTKKTPADESIVHVIKKAHELGMKVMLKPHLDLLDKSDGSWRGEIGCLKESGWDEWFSKYRKFLDYYARIANKEKVEMICIGTELSCTATVKGYLWEDMIKGLRKRYKGLLTYAAHWDRYQDIRFWKSLDFVGINAYFPLTEKQQPTYDELLQGWTKWVAEMEEFQQKVDMPIIFPEIGCNSADGAAIRPWEHVSRSEVNLELQEDYYKALLNTFWNKEWFYGMYWWYWGTNIRMGGKYNRGFTPQNKPAEIVLRKWYAKPAQREPVK